jgi:hypothetical protein
MLGALYVHHPAIHRVQEIPIYSTTQAVFADPETEEASINRVHSSVFGFYALWLIFSSLFPYTDLSTSVPINEQPNKPDRDLVFPSSTPFHPGLSEQTYIAPSPIGPIDITRLADSSQDDNPAYLSVARRLLQAYFLGQDLGAKHFQDAVMNAILKSLVGDIPPPVDLITHIYSQSGSLSCGLKRLFADYFAWCILATVKEEEIWMVGMFTHDNGIWIGVPHGLLDVDEFPLVFVEDVLRIVQKIQCGEERIRFGRLWRYLRDEGGGVNRCRYHEHGVDQLCFNLIVDDTGVGEVWFDENKGEQYERMEERAEFMEHQEEGISAEEQDKVMKEQDAVTERQDEVAEDQGIWVDKELGVVIEDAGETEWDDGELAFL